MQYPWISQIDRLFNRPPTVGELLDLCENNYRLLMELAPELRKMQGGHASCRPGRMNLYLQIVEQTPYTTVIHLTYYFPQEDGQKADPDALLRVYHDAQQIEVINLRQQVLPLSGGYQHPSLFNKWKINVFLAKWLSYCKGKKHRFILNDEFLTKMHG